MNLRIASVLATAVAMVAPVFAAATFTQLPDSIRRFTTSGSRTRCRSPCLQGSVTISLDVLRPTADITLNALDLSFSAARLTGPHNLSLATPVIRMNAGKQTATLSFGRRLPAGRYELAIDYAGKIGTQATGLFAMDYETPAGGKRALYTQLAVAEARRLLPSWDEPGFKTTFTLDATVPTAQMAVSNMPVAARTDVGNGRTRVTFERTPKMSTYLLFFALGDFDRLATTVDGTELGVVTQAGLSSQAAFALESSERVLREYNDYFGSAYPLPKLDNIASPGSSMFYSAMENWGAIFTFEYAILLDPSIATQADRQDSFETAAHEIAHMCSAPRADEVVERPVAQRGIRLWLGSRNTERTAS